MVMPHVLFSFFFCCRTITRVMLPYANCTRMTEDHLGDLRTFQRDYAHNTYITVCSGTCTAASDNAEIFDGTCINADTLCCVADY